jgi:MSHA biogenesis protein MshP
MAIFLITVMALIVATIVQLQESSGEMEALDVLSTRAFYAAESGAQAGLAQALREDPAECGVVTPVDKAQFEEAGLQGCSRTVSCDQSGSAVLITSEGICGSGDAEAVRVIEVKAQ